jgi:cell wall-associated NlpC family hydrolase
MAGIDCVGLVIKVAHDLGLSDFDETGYGRLPEGKRLLSGLNAHMDRVKDYQMGDVLLMRFQTDPQHLAIVTDVGIIHALTQGRKVLEHSLDDIWRARIIAAYSFRGLE